MEKYISIAELINIAKESEDNEKILSDNGLTKDEVIKRLANELEYETQPKGESKGEWFYKNKVSNFINNTCADEEGFIQGLITDHRTLQQSFFRLMMKCIKAFSEYKDWQIDGRNEAAVRKSKIIVKALNEADESIGCPFI